MMDDNKKLEEVFAKYSPVLNDSDEFMSRLSRRLEAVEYVRKIQGKQVSQYKLLVLLAFVCGIVSGGILFAVIAAMPKGLLIPSVDIQSVPLNFLLENSQMILLFALAVLMCYGIVYVLNTVQELYHKDEE